MQNLILVLPVNLAYAKFKKDTTFKLILEVASNLNT